MTHNELLDAVKDIPTTRVVVELHKPNARGDECANCGWECGKELVSYPCPTIKAIEKELR
jgi:hypothetical protein